jgi:hypothetical protein
MIFLLKVIVLAYLLPPVRSAELAFFAMKEILPS